MQYYVRFAEYVIKETLDENGDSHESVRKYFHVRLFDTLIEAERFKKELHSWDFDDSCCSDIDEHWESSMTLMTFIYRPMMCGKVDKNMNSTSQLTYYESNFLRY